MQTTEEQLEDVCSVYGVMERYLSSRGRHIAGSCCSGYVENMQAGHQCEVEALMLLILSMCLDGDLICC